MSSSAANPMPLLGVSNLKLYYATSRGPVRAVDDVSMTIEGAGEALGVVGESGSGKSSLALALMRLLPPNVARLEGRVLFNERDLMELSQEEFRKEIRWRAIAMVFQGAMNALNPVLRVGAQITERPLLDGVAKAEAYRRAGELAEMVGLPQEVLQRYPHELSGGMKQRVIIAMALMMKPQLLILDEPTSALDVSVQAQVMNLLKRLKQGQGLSMLFITHDIALASDICDRIAVAYGGQHVESGTAEEVLRQPKHPYTQKLIASIPRLRGAGNLEFLPGAPPDLVDPPPGCRFHPRCPYVFDRCKTEEPPFFQVTPSQRVRCWLYNETAKQQQ